MTVVEAGQRIALKNILFSTDFSPYSDVALPYGLAIARQYGAKVYGAHIVSSEDYLFTAPDTWPAHLQYEEQLRKEVTGHLEEQLGAFPHVSLVRTGDTWHEVSKLISEYAIDLLVMGTHGRTGVRKLLMGSVAEKIFRQAACPVLSVGPNVPTKAESRIKFQRILFATKFGEESLAALPYALSFAEEEQSELALLRVVEQPEAGVPRAEQVKSSLWRRLEQLVPPDAASWCHLEYLVEFSHRFARPAERIVEVAKDRQADLIVLGVRPTQGTLSAVTHVAHSTAQHVVAHATCPVLTVRG